MAVKNPRQQDPSPGEWVLLSKSDSTAPAGYMRITTNRYELPDGSVADWDLVNGGRTVAVLALTTDRQVVIAHQFRPGPGRHLDELPGGYVRSDEDPESAAARELLTETGYQGQISVIASTWLSASATTCRYAAIALDCEVVAEPAFDPGEFCETHLLSLTTFRALVRSGQMTDIDIAYLCLDHLGLLSQGSAD